MAAVPMDAQCLHTAAEVVRRAAASAALVRQVAADSEEVASQVEADSAEELVMPQRRIPPVAEAEVTPTAEATAIANS